MMKKNYTINKIILLFSFAILTSCGFHLRGEIIVPDVMKDLYVTGNTSLNGFGEVLFRRIKQLGITRVNNKVSSSAILTVTRNEFTRRVLTVDSATKASAYKLDMIVGFNVIDPEGKNLVNSQEIRQTREYNIDPNNALASGDQEDHLKMEMNEFIVNQMLTRISFALKNTK